MGLDFSSLAAMANMGGKHEPPKTVLVPPMFERDLKARSRMAKSSYDYLFSKPSLRWLFGDYMGLGLNTVLLFAPQADPRVSVKAKLGAGQAATMSIRYQPYGVVEPLCFVDVKASPKSPGDVTLRACAFSTDTGLGAFATLPLAREVSGQRAALGVRYSSPQFTAGAVVQPAANVLSSVWACARSQGMTLGVQVRPGLTMHDLPGSLQAATAGSSGSSGGSGGGCGGGGDFASWLRGVTSVALSYSPEGRTRAGQHTFTASMEMQEGKDFVISFFQHMAAVRQVFNPLEKDDVIGITNYIDVGLQLHVPLAAEGHGGAAVAAVPMRAPAGGSSALAAVGGSGAAVGAAAGGGGSSGSGSGSTSGVLAGAAGLRLAGAWQVNKNVYLKGRLGGDGVALMAAMKTWFQPSLTLAAAVERSFESGLTRTGLTLQVENFGRLRYERSQEATAAGRILTQRHEATEAQEAAAAGDRPLVDRYAGEEVFNVPEPASVTYM